MGVEFLTAGLDEAAIGVLVAAASRLQQLSLPRA